MAIKASDVGKLRQMTGAGMMDCKKALTEANGDYDAAIDIIRKRGQAVANKRSDREASEGCVLAGVNGAFAAVLALNCETDFVAKNDNFIAMTKSFLNAALANKLQTAEEVLNATMEGRKIQDIITEQIGVIGEKIEIAYYGCVNAESAAAYIHPGNKLATIVAFNKAGVDAEVMRDVAMQTAAMAPVSVNRESVPQNIIAKELEIGRDKAREEGKPEAMLDKIAEGRLNKFFQESTLLEQAFIKENKQTVQQYLTSKTAGLTVTAFKRFSLS